MFDKKVLAVAIGMMAGVVVGAVPAHAKVILRISHFLPPVAAAQQKVIQPWCDAIEAQSKGELVCQIYPAMQLGGTPGQLVDQVRNGVADIVWTAPGYSTGRFPGIEAMELPFMVSDATSGSLAAWEFYKENLGKEFSDYKVLALHIDGGSLIHTSRKQVKTLADMENLKLRTPTRLASKTLQALGGTPVSMPPAQVTEAISKGVVDGGILPWELMRPTKLDEVTKFHTAPPAGKPYFCATVLAFLMNKDSYNRLPDDLKQVIDSTTGRPLVEKFGHVWDEVTVENRDYARKIGNTVSALDEATYDQMRMAAQPVINEWIQDTDKKGLDGKALAQAARTLNEKYAAQETAATH